MSVLEAAAAQARIIAFCGIPGVGKSLLLREQLGLALAAGRRVTRLQWDVARQAFEIPPILSRYPEVEGSTHVVIRRAVGLWVRDAIAAWDARHPDLNELLLIEAPLVGGRMSELAWPLADRAETLLSASSAQFFVPTPTREVRRAIESARRAESIDPRHVRDAANAVPELVDALWLEVAAAAQRLGLAADADAPGYSPQLYFAVYRQLLRHRHVSALPIERVLANPGSPHAVRAATEELAPRPEETPPLIARAESEGQAAITERAAQWYRLELKIP
jgi:hypothetical protein